MALERVDLAVHEGELVAVVGANGAGKSTLLKLAAGLLPPSHGTVRVLGRPPRDVARRIAYLPQAEHLRWDHPLLVEDVVLFGRAARLGLGRRPKASDREIARGALARLDALRLLRRPIPELSGGERQRVLLARALASEPEVLLLDEAATGVDPATEEQLMDVLAALARQGRTIVMATHDLAGVVAHFRRVICLNRAVIADGDPSILHDEAVLRATYGGHRPATPFLVGDEHHA
ncbi:MAG: metal ABC transporter ATP-binding protein [Candidatus Limnocylindria bacterium]